MKGFQVTYGGRTYRDVANAQFEVAIAVGDSPGDAVFVAVRSGDELPPEVKELLKGS
ncbi:DUF6281 family protein [Streptomyces sp. T028]|uniref:DUF6281 family protein n=1 Tax=Streptomyces sp. T028 TaxID=3394379 RepID=UPI003A85EFFA